MIFSENRFAFCAGAALRVGIMLGQAESIGHDAILIGPIFRDNPYRNMV